MKKALAAFGSILMLLVPICSIYAQQTSAVDSLFNRGIAEYRSGSYNEALKMFSILDKIYPKHNRKTASILMQAKSYYQLKEYSKALNLFSELEYSFPGSSYIDDAKYGSATCYFNMGKNKKSVEKLLNLIDSGGNEILLRKAAKLSLDIIQNKLTDADLKELLKKIDSERGNAVITMQLANRYMSEQQFQAAKELLRQYRETYEGSSYVVQMEELYSRADKQGKGVLKIGVILPLSGPFQQEGQSLLNGITYGVEKRNRSESSRVELLVRDSGSDIVRAITHAQELAENQEVSIIIGELEGDVSAAVAAVCQEKSVPLVIPVSSQKGLPRIGKNIFQIRSDIETRGKAVAEYAVNGLGLQNMVVIAPAGSYGKNIVSAFSTTVKALGGNILSEQWYYETAEDLKSQFQAVREAGIQKMLQDSSVVIVDKEKYKEMYAEHPVVNGVIHVDQDVPALVDSSNFKITCIDGVFLPVYHDDLQYIIPQVSFYNIGGKLFGGSFWYDEEILNTNREYCNGVIFTSDFYIDKTNYTYYHFRDEFRRSFKKTPEKFEVYGYDAVSLVFNVTGEIAETRENIRRKLSTVSQLRGLGGYITLTETGSNSFVHLLQYKDGTIFRLK